MKLTLLCFALTVSLYGQPHFASASMDQTIAYTGTGWINGATSTATASFTGSAKEPVVGAGWLVEYLDTEKCYECPSRYAIMCSASTPDCGVPTKEVQRFDPFKSKEDAIKSLNNSSGMANRKFVRLLQASEVPLRTIEKIETVPQPPLTVKTVTYKAEDDKKK